MFGTQLRLGELLIGQRLITQDDLKAGLASQVIYGGRIGSNLVEGGCVTLDQLSLALGEQHGVPAASSQAFEKVNTAILGAVPREYCAMYFVCPLYYDGHTLHLAMQDPHRLDLVDRIGRELGMTILPYAVPQLRLLYYLEKHYQLRRPNRFLRAEGLRRAPERRRFLQATTLPPSPAGQPPRQRPPTMEHAVRATPMSAVSKDAGTQLVGLDQIVGLEEITGHTPRPGVNRAETEQTVLAPREARSVDSIDEVLKKIDEAPHREAVHQQLLRPVIPGADLTVLFLRRGDLAVAVGAWGTEVPQEQVTSLVVPLSITSSLVRQALIVRTALQGRVGDDPLQQMIATYLRRPLSNMACVVSIWMDAAPINVLCVQSASAFPEGAAGLLEKIAQRAAGAYRRLMQQEVEATMADIPAGTSTHDSALWAGPDSWAGSGKAKPLPTTPAVYNRFGRYTLVCRFASGGMANLFLARATGPDGFEKLIAIKRVHDHLIHEVEFIQRFADEARLAAKISHPNVVTVIEFGCLDGSYFIAMEYVDGESLAALLNRTQLPLPMCARIVANAAAGLHAAHELRDENGTLLQVVHRDVSPHNLLISYQGAVKVVDFGVAQARSNLHVSFVGTIAGKLAYMAPEQARGVALDRRVDIFSLGIILYEMTTKQRLFKLDTDAATLDRLLNGVIEPPSKLIPQYPKSLERIVMQALERDPQKRPRTAQEVQERLEEYIIESGAPVLESSVASVMQRVFADRIQQKRQILHPSS